MELYNKLLPRLPGGKVLEVCIGLHWTAVVAEVGGEQCCGLASTLIGNHQHGMVDVPQAGELESFAGPELARFVLSDRPTLRSVGAAAANALLSSQPNEWVEANASEIIIKHGRQRNVALIGHFPFIPELRAEVGQLHVLEINPAEDELPAAAAPDILPRADVVAITSLTLLNRTHEDLLGLCSTDALVLLLGPSTPLSPILFDYGVDILSGAVVISVDQVLRAIKQGANFRQVHQAGVQLVTLYRPGLSD